LLGKNPRLTITMKPIIAIIGRPNVGKSTFFNRVTGTRKALVDDFPGVTRDRHYGDATWNGIGEDADVIILLLDGKYGISPFDEDIVKILRGLTKPVFYVVNKIDGVEQEVKLYEFYTLGIKKLYPISAEHRYGISDFLDNLTSVLPETTSDQTEDMIKLAVVGKPNVGKSSLINRILGQKRYSGNHPRCHRLCFQY
jgi:GTP-binding protein